MADEDLNILDLPDDEITKLTPEQFAEKFGNTESEQKDSEPEETVEEEETSEEEEVSEPVQRQEDRIFEGATETVPETEQTAPVTEESESTVDYKTEYSKLFEPFKASGREIQIKSVDEARRLMQMGVDYAKKMQALKPHLRLMKALERNDLLSEEKINFLIALDKKEPEAVSKYFKDKGLDPIEVDTSVGEDYRPKSYAPTEQEMNLDEVLDSIRETTSYSRTIDELGNKWDNASKQTLMQYPQLIRVINDHVETGIYDQIINAVQTERLLGRLEGISDLDAYKQIGDQIQERGGFNRLNPGSNKPVASKPNQQAVQRDAKRKAAQPTRLAPAKSGKSNFNPLALSDEEFERMGMSAFR
jgi:hypothetical protein